MIRPLELIDDMVAEGHSQFTFEEAVRALHVSPTAAANALRRLQEKGLVDRLTKGVYAIRPLGSLGTPPLQTPFPWLWGPPSEVSNIGSLMRPHSRSTACSAIQFAPSMWLVRDRSASRG